MIPWRWNTIPVNKIDNTVFKAIDSSKNKIIDFDKLQNVFLLPEKDVKEVDGETEQKDESKKNQPKVIPQQRCTVIEIIMNRLPYSTTEIKNAILKADMQVLTVDTLNELRSMLPQKTYEEEKTMLANYKGSYNDLIKPEQFLFDIFQIPRIRETLSALAYSIETNARIAEAKQNIKIVFAALEELKNPKVIKLLEIALAAGNYLNSGGKNPKGPAQGIRLQSLLKMNEVVSQKNKVSLLNFIVRQLDNKKYQYINIY